MYCMHCGKQIDDSSVFCQQCGQPVNADSASASTGAQPASAGAQPAAASEPSQPASAGAQPAAASAPSQSASAGAQPAAASASVQPASASEPGSAPAQQAYGNVSATIPFQPVPGSSPASASYQPASGGAPSSASYQQPVASVPVQTGSPQSKRNPAPFIILGIVAVLLACAGVYFAIGGCKAEEKPVSASFANGTPQAVQKDSSEGTTSGSATSTDSSAASSGSDSANKSSDSDSAENSDASSDSKTTQSLSNGEYILPASSTRYYTRQELSTLSNWELYIARNEVFARYGRGFKNDDLRDYFNGKSWYVQRYTPEEFDAKWGESILNDCELKNVELIKEIERANGSPYLS